MSETFLKWTFGWFHYARKVVPDHRPKLFKIILEEEVWVSKM